MQELFDSLKRITPSDVEYYLDTCFLFHVLSHRLEKELVSFCSQHSVAISSFNIGEFVYHHHDMSSQVKRGVRRLINNGLRLFVVDIEVAPGNPSAEHEYVDRVDTALLELIPDPSDAVLFALALESKASVLTRDKHHLFTTALENYSSDHGIFVYNNFPA